MESKQEVIQGDCLEVMRSIPDGSIDAVICDPPYGTTACKWDIIIPFEPMWEQLKRITKKNGAIVLFGSQPFTSALVMSNQKMFRYQWIWQKERGANFLQGNFQPLKVHEDINVFAIGKTVYNPQKTINTKKKQVTSSENSQKRKEAGLSVTHFRSSDIYEKDKLLPRSIQYFSRDIPKGGTVHPTQKPVALMEYLIKTYTNEGETVLDFAAGSGTTGVAAKNLNRNFILIEKEPEYVEIIKKRLAPQTLL
jgi:site-specific DNA-methyltransferase (adenine-specific)